MNRYQVLDDLVNFKKPVDDLSKELAQFDWDYDGDPLIIESSHLCKVLNGFLSKEYTAEDIEGWANLIEGREDVDFETGKGGEISKIIHYLANPFLEGEMNEHICRDFLIRLAV